MTACRCPRYGLILALWLFGVSHGVAGQAVPGGSAAARSGELFLVLPFEQSVRDARYAWLSEGLAELFADRLAADGRPVFPRNEWMAALEKLGLPPSTRFTRATMLKVAEQLDADYVVYGEFATDGKRLSLSARVLQVSPAALSPAFSETGTLDDLMEVQGRAAWQVARYTDAPYPLNRPAYLQKIPRRRLDAFEQYIRGLLAGDEPRLRNFREAARLDPDWPDPAFALGEAYYAARNCEPALTWFSRVPPGHRRGIEAGFLAGVCHLLRHDSARAESAFSGVLFAIARQSPRSSGPAEVHNNLAIALSRQGKSTEAAGEWQRAQQLDDGQPDYWFNAAWGEFRSKNYAAAARLLRELLKRNPEEADARALLVAALERAGRATEAATAREECSAGNCSASVALQAALRATAEPSRTPLQDGLTRVERISTSLDAGALLFSYRATPEGNGNGARNREHFEIHLARGRKAWSEGHLDEAQRDLAEAVLLAPDSAESRVALADVYVQQRRYDDAEREFRAALWARENADVRVRLARLYAARGQVSEARTELRAALRAEPSHAEARRMLDSLTAPGGPPK